MASRMHALNAAYHHGDLAALLKLEAEILLSGVMSANLANSSAIESALHDIERAADTYAESYRHMLRSPLNELMLRALAARLAGWDWMETVVRKIDAAANERERAQASAGIAQIQAWREEVQAA